MRSRGSSPLSGRPGWRRTGRYAASRSCGGTYNTVFRVTLDDSRDWVVKIPPAGSAGLSYERDLLKGEIAFYTAAAGLDPAVPEVVHSEPDPEAAAGRHVIMTARPGAPWHECDAGMPDGERSRLRRPSWDG